MHIQPNTICPLCDFHSSDALRGEGGDCVTSHHICFFFPSSFFSFFVCRLLFFRSRMSCKEGVAVSKINDDGGEVLELTFLFLAWSLFFFPWNSSQICSYCFENRFQSKETEQYQCATLAKKIKWPENWVSESVLQQILKRSVLDVFCRFRS